MQKGEASRDMKLGVEACGNQKQEWYRSTVYDIRVEPNDIMQGGLNQRCTGKSDSGIPRSNSEKVVTGACNCDRSGWCGVF